MAKQELMDLNLVDKKLNIQIKDVDGEIVIRLGKLEKGEGDEGERLADVIGLCNVRGTTDLIRIDCENGRFIDQEYLDSKTESSDSEKQGE